MKIIIFTELDNVSHSLHLTHHYSTALSNAGDCKRLAQNYITGKNWQHARATVAFRL